jgi:hypothetical protein
LVSRDPVPSRATDDLASSLCPNCGFPAYDCMCRPQWEALSAWRKPFRNLELLASTERYGANVAALTHFPVPCAVLRQPKTSLGSLCQSKREHYTLQPGKAEGRPADSLGGENFDGARKGHTAWARLSNENGAKMCCHNRISAWATVVNPLRPGLVRCSGSPLLSPKVWDCCRATGAHLNKQ